MFRDYLIVYLWRNCKFTQYYMLHTSLSFSCLFLFSFLFRDLHDFLIALTFFAFPFIFFLPFYVTGGQAKTLMFVQLNPDVESYSETISTLKFAERVSGVELGAAKSNKEGRDIRELMEQVYFIF